MNRNKVFLLVLPAIGAAILAVLSQFSLAIGAVPITLQTFAIGLIATIFKPREAVSATLLYLLLGAIGGIIGLNILGNLDFSKAIAVGVTPFILPDLLKMLLIAIISLPVLKSLGFHPYFADKQKN